MDISALLETLNQSTAYKDWQTSHTESYLAHIFKLVDDANADDWQAGYYNADDTMTTFVVSQGKVQKASSENIFKKPEAKILALDINTVKVEAIMALAAAEKKQAVEFPQESPQKIIMILQNLQDEGQIYNITYITHSFKALNFKIDAGTGKIKSVNLSSLMDFKVQ